MKTETLKSICDIKTGKLDVNEGNARGKYNFFTCALEPLKSDTFSFDCEAIILPGNGANVGEVIYYVGKFDAYQRTYVLRNFKVEPKYVFYFLKQVWRRKVTGKQYGSATNYIRYNNIAELRIPLPTIEEQKRIADILDKADKLRQLRKQAIEKLDELLQSVFIDMFGDPRKINQKIKNYTLGNYVNICMGQSPSGESYNNNQNGIPLINGPVEFGRKFPIERQWTTKPIRLSKMGDILFCVRGATAGRMNWSDKEYCIGRGVATISSNGYLSNSYIYFYLYLMYEYFQLTANGSTFINITKDDLAKLKLNLPSKNSIVEYDKIFNNIETLKEDYYQSKNNSENLFYSLLQKFFNGEGKVKN